MADVGEIRELNGEFSSLPCLCTLRIIEAEVYLLGYYSCWQPLHAVSMKSLGTHLEIFAAFPKCKMGVPPNHPSH